MMSANELPDGKVELPFCSVEFNGRNGHRDRAMGWLFRRTDDGQWRVAEFLTGYYPPLVWRAAFPTLPEALEDAARHDLPNWKPQHTIRELRIWQPFPVDPARQSEHDLGGLHGWVETEAGGTWRATCGMHSEFGPSRNTMWEALRAAREVAQHEQRHLQAA